MTTADFKAFPKITRHTNVRATITEKIDGTNGCIVFPDLALDDDGQHSPEVLRRDVVVQSRKRIITPGKRTDNAGFAAWVHDNIDELYEFFGPGHHFGEWWGVGIQRGYGLVERRFSPFNTRRFNEEWFQNDVGGFADGVRWPKNVTPVPVLAECALSELDAVLGQALDQLYLDGSIASGNGWQAEGCMVWLAGLNAYVKAPFDSNPKSAVAS